MSPKKKLEERAQKLAVAACRRHILMCVGPDCCGSRPGKAAWKALKRALKENPGLENTVLRSKVACLGVCRNGPVAVVYPEGTWYAELTADRIPEFVQKHLVAGCPIRDWIFATNPLRGPAE